MTAYYNEHDRFAAAWLRELIGAGLIAPGDVDERDIQDVRPDELRGYAQVHCFAGIGGWSAALRLAGWPDDEPVWTGSCPCQPFSAAGRGGGVADERHLWPHFYHLIRECRPGRLFGEQVASPDGLAWLDVVQSDLEGAGYATAALDLCAAGFGAPHIRQRLYWAADATFDRRVEGVSVNGGCSERDQPQGAPGRTPERGVPRGVANPTDERHDGGWSGEAGRDQGESKRSCDVGGVGQPDGSGRFARGVAASATRYRGSPLATGDVGGLADATGSRPPETRQYECGPPPLPPRPTKHGGVDGTRRPGPTNGFWSGADWLLCRDGKWRPTEPAIQPLATGVPGRVGQLRGAGNAIVVPQAAAFVRSTMGWDASKRE